MPINVFGQGAVQTAYVSYIEFDISANSLTLIWPTSYVDVPYTNATTGIHYNVLAASMTVTASGGSHTITLPNAMQGSVGDNFIVTNTSATAFNILLNDGSTVLLSVTTGLNANSFWVQLTDNSTTNGTWRFLTFGAGSSTIQPTSLAGPGLVPYPVDTTKLSTNMPVQTKTANYTVVQADRASLIIWQGGSGIITLPTGSVVTGFYISVHNQGSGSIIVTTPSPSLTPPPGTGCIDGSLTLPLEPGQSTMLIWDGVNWWTLGLGSVDFNAISANTVPISTANTSLTAEQALSQIQLCTGLLTANSTVYFPDSTNDWYIANNTTGAFTLSVCVGGPGSQIGSPTIIPQGNREIFYAVTGSGMFIIPNNIPDEITFPDGSAAAPGMSFTADTTTGFYRAAGTILGAAVSGAAQATFTITGINIPAGKFVTLDNGSAAAPSLRFTASNTLGLYQIGGNTLGVSVGGVGKATFTGSGLNVLGTGTQNVNINGATATITSTDTAGDTGSISIIGQGTAPSNNSLLQIGAGPNNVITIGSAGAGIGSDWKYFNTGTTLINKARLGGNTTSTFLSLFSSVGAVNLQQATLTANDGGPFTITTQTAITPHIGLSMASTGAVTFPISPLTVNATDGSNLAIQVEAPANGATFSYTGSNAQVNKLILGGNATSTAAVINSSQNAGAISLEIIVNDNGPYTIGAAEWTPQIQISVASNGVVSFGNAPGTLTALMPTSVNGALAYFNGTAWVTLAPGTAGQVLTMTGGIPAWA